MKKSRFSALVKIAKSALIFILALFVFLGIGYIENHIIDDSMLPSRNPDHIFPKTELEDSILNYTIKGEYFLMTKKYVEFMIVNGRDRYGKVHSPLFATTLDRETGNAFSSNPPLAPKGIRDRDRTYRGANPSNHNGLYGLLYQMTKLTKDPRYAEEADAGIAWFFHNCQIPATYLLPWGEHMGWDFFKERPIYWKFQFWIHELKSYSHWDRAWELAPEEVERFALALWDHQIFAKKGSKAGEFSRHANALMHYPFWGKGFPSHGGKYIEVWAKAWIETKNAEFILAISTLLDYFDKNTSDQSGAIRYATKFPDQYSLGHNMGLARSLYRAMEIMPDSIAMRMKIMADNTDPLYLSFDHEPTENGKGFLKSAHVHTLVPGEYRSEHTGGSFRTKMWGSGYSASNHVGSANSCLSRYTQTGLEGYKDLFLTTAETYYIASPPEKKILYPGNYSSIIRMMRNAYRLTGEKRFLEKAVEYAEISIGAVMDDSSPLPKASNQNDHYEAITGANGFMSNLLGLWMDLNEIEIKDME